MHTAKNSSSLSELNPDLKTIFAEPDDGGGNADGFDAAADYVVWRDALGGDGGHVADGASNTFMLGERDTRTPGDDIGLDPKFMADGLFPIEGDDGNNVLHGTDEDDIIFAHGGHDDVFGYDGIDQLHGDAGHDFLAGGADNDYLAGGGGNDALYGDEPYAENGDDGNDVLSGGDGDDFMWGQGGDDMLIGGAGDNLYYGGSGDDLLVGSQSGDEMYGGEGADRFACIGEGVANIHVFDYNFEDEGDLVDGDSFIYYAGGNYTGVYEDGFLKFVLWDYNAEADGIGFFDYTLEPEM